METENSAAMRRLLNALYWHLVRLPSLDDAGDTRNLQAVCNVCELAHRLFYPSLVQRTDTGGWEWVMPEPRNQGA